MRPLMDINISTPPRVIRTAEGLRDVEEWGLKVQKMANVHSITLAFVCPPPPSPSASSAHALS